MLLAEFLRQRQDRQLSEDRRDDYGDILEVSGGSTWEIRGMIVVVGVVVVVVVVVRVWGVSRRSRRDDEGGMVDK